MVVDDIKNVAQYFGMGERIKKALKFIAETDFSGVKEKIDYDIEGKCIYAWACEFEQKHISKGRWEAHRKYMDIHYILEGSQLMGYTYKANLTSNEPFQEEKDIGFLDGTGDMLRLEAGTFMLVLPQDAHMPDIAPFDGAKVKKVVVKILA